MHLRTPAALLMTVAAWFAPGGMAYADTTVEVLGTYPAGTEVTLGSDQSFYIRLAYRTDQPVRIWAEPYFQGKPANAGSNPSQTYTDSGETFGWFFFMRPGDQVDEIRIKAGDGGTRTTPVVATLQVHAVGGSTPMVDRSEPAWVTEMKQRASQAQQADYAASMADAASPGSVALFTGFMLLMLAAGLFAFAAPAWGLWRWRGGWRVAATMPAALMAVVALRITVDGARDPTSHNLWPFEILQADTLSLVAMGVLVLARKFARTRNP
jgi:hypothetical protein